VKRCGEISCAHGKLLSLLYLYLNLYLYLYLSRDMAYHIEVPPCNKKARTRWPWPSLAGRHEGISRDFPVDFMGRKRETAGKS
jgi:hypothetical protein